MSNLRQHSASAYMEVRRLNNKPFSSDSGHMKDIESRRKSTDIKYSGKNRRDFETV